MSAYLARVVSSSEYLGLRSLASKVAKKLSRRVHTSLGKAEEYTRGLVTGGTLFEELGFYYVGPIDGHNLDHLIPVLENVRDAEEGPVLVHVVTKKGKGYAPAEDSADKYHGVTRFDVITGEQKKSEGGPPSYQNVFGQTLTTLAETDQRICAITAAMPSGTGVDLFAKAHPKRAFDVGIAEQHAVTFAAGLAAQGMRPFAAIYSTFLQRAYDQVVHDVAIQNLPVRFAIDRAGLVGADGATHAGSFDVTYLATLPNFVVMSPADEAELVHMTYTAACHDSGPIAFRYPRGSGTGVVLPEVPQQLEIGRGRIVRGSEKSGTVALLSLGSRLGEALKAADTLEAKGLSTTVADLRFVKPLDTDLIRRLAATHEVVVTVEEGSIGGLGAHVLTLASDEGWLDAGLKIRTMRLPDSFLDQDAPEKQYDEARLNAPRHRRDRPRRAAPQQRTSGRGPRLTRRSAMGALLGIPEWLAVILWATFCLIAFVAVSIRSGRSAHCRLAARRPSPTQHEFLSLLAPDVSPQTAAFWWEKASFYVQPPLTPHPDDELSRDLRIDDDDWGMDWPGGFCGAAGLSPDRPTRSVGRLAADPAKLWWLARHEAAQAWMLTDSRKQHQSRHGHKHLRRA